MILIRVFFDFIVVIFFFCKILLFFYFSFFGLDFIIFLGLLIFKVIRGNCDYFFMINFKMLLIFYGVKDCL